MAGSTGKRTSTSKNKKKQANTGRKQVQHRQVTEQEAALFHEIGLIVFFVCMVLLFCCNFGIVGPVGNSLSAFMFGVFGLMAYVVPVLFFVGVAFHYANEGNPSAVRKQVAGIVLSLMIGIVFDLLAKDASSLESYSIKAIYENCSSAKNGGGVFAGSLCYLFQHYLGTIGTVLVVILCAAISIILLTERSLLDGVKNSSERMRELSREEARRRREYNEQRRLDAEELQTRREEERLRREEERAKREEERRLKAEEKENEKILRMDKKVSGIMANTTIVRPEEPEHRDDIHEIVYNEEIPEESYEEAAEEPMAEEPAFEFEKVRINSAHQITMAEEYGVKTYEEYKKQPQTETSDVEDLLGQSIRIHKEDTNPKPQDNSHLTAAAPVEKPVITAPQNEISGDVSRAEKKIPKKYMFPPLSRLQKGRAVAGDSERELKETAMRLQQTLNTFGVKVTITDISQGPSVTRYELQPEQGVKVSKIVGLADDIKLNLAATDIRIEAPIPGKAAIGIEVPNKENMPVALRDLLESKEFREFPSNLAFAVGKDIAGKVVVADIAKMPHMLIAGATGSGKSVCINTMIMSTLYKAHPDDVKLIMIDPKVVELSVYNGIPHLLIPVVTDPKKASAALHWGVTEMEDRYRKFADYNVRDLKGYNKKLESMQESGEESVPAKLPQIVIIVDELADLMMVCPGEVEESICRLAQLARAAGIHLIIATQRPSVDVITGLIKANMPSRVAFSVSSGVDSRTILDMNGAEKLLGKGDMLFYPQGYTKPARIQGAFVSDKEVSDVVDFLKNQSLGNTYAEDVEEKILNIGSGTGGGGMDGESELDEFFEKAGRFIIEQDKASIGALQRLLKIGFNRAARIMDQLCEYGVVDKGEGTKPRKILMSPEQFEQLVEEIV